MRAQSEWSDLRPQCVVDIVQLLSDKNFAYFVAFLHHVDAR